MTDSVYPPSEDSYLLRDAAVGEVRRDDTVLEVGTGSGFVAKALADEARTVVATDISNEAVRAARERGVSAVRTDLVAALDARFDLVIFNPPYLPDDDTTPDDAMADALGGGETGREVAERFLDTVPRVLAPDGRILLVTSSLSGVEAFEEREGYEAERVASERYFFEEVVVLRMRPTP
ncbi:MAG: release factor glutamine methyltransferase [Methanobacteriota archaeon]|jgi:release factor glutamine methyltransferase|uniref:Methyltransferase n=1 Tax=Halorutilus salinus TaxID=2487751 RepID=A0A9Q4C3Y3_9EURY|nr:HemK2/MTQ2 family protein methyltransferase [Halorutilus salinus]MCX2818019.1 methyltransferase [Halorutilus salinus]